MSRTPPTGLTLPPPPSRSELVSSSALSTDDSPVASPSHLFPHATVPAPRATRRSFRTSFSHSPRARRGSRATTTAGIDEMIAVDDEVPKLPTLVPGIRPAYSTPLPTLPTVVLVIAILSELLSANLCTPFLLKMVEGFFLDAGYEPGSETEAAVGFWTGNLVSVFFITQFLTSLLWSSIADRHGRRAVIVASLTGSALALITFGTSGSLEEAITVRLVQGVFGGAVGVFRGSIRDITDETNATRAYAILGFSWGFGGVMGPILGGVFESPAQNFSRTFLGRVPLFETYPYLLPTLIAGCVLVAGAILACFLSWDGGLRGGSRIALPLDKDEPLAGTGNGTGPSPARKSPRRDVSPAASNRTAVPSLRTKQSGMLSPQDAEAAHGNGLAAPYVSGRRDSRASLGTAYGYGGIRSKHPTLAARAAVEAARRVSHAAGGAVDLNEEEEEEAPKMGLAQKLLLANEENTFNINDLWVSAAVAQDQAVFDEDETDDGSNAAEELEGGSTPQPSPSLTTDDASASAARHSAHRNRITSGGFRAHHPGHRLSVTGNRRFSTSSGTLPAIFANTGLHTPPPLFAAYDDSPGVRAEESDPFFSSPGIERRAQPIGGLSVIAERPGHSGMQADAAVSPALANAVEKKPSPWGALPWLIISQYGLLALHNTTHDQIFLSFLVTQYESGGLGLAPASFSFLIALMCCFQLLYQFWLYPRLGPPLGRFSHLQMFRMGCICFIPAYLLLPLLHSVTSPKNPGGFLTMTLLTLITAVRYCGGTLGYTSIMVLINAMSPPHVVGLANGLAQSTVSLARFVGPVMGGGIWSATINGNPGGYYQGFIIVTAACAIQWGLSLLIR